MQRWMTFVVLSLILAASALARVPRGVQYQGTLTNPDGSPMDTTVAMVFELFPDSVGGTAVWSETHPAIPLANDLFNVRLGWINEFPDSVLRMPALWLGVTVGNNSEMTPRIKVVSTFFALRAGQVDSLSAENVVQLLHLLQTLPDADGDGYTKLSMGGDDCDDMNPLIHPGATEVCDGQDNNCDGQIDEGFQTLWYLDADGDGYGNDDSTVVSCDSIPGYVSIGGDCDDSNAAINPGAFDICDLLDNNCDGQTDENGSLGNWYLDNDHDGWGTGTPTFGCPPNYTDWSEQAGDCDDADSTVHPGAPEICDGIDQNCDGIIDNDTPGCTEYYRDEDQDGYGDEGESFCLCAPSFPYTATISGDCDDTNPNTHPGAPEICDGLDNNCDGQTDENAVDCTIFFRDLDQDGYGDSGNSMCLCSPSYPYTALQGGDCDDSNPNVHPGAVELCDGLDNDCDGFVDNGNPCPVGYTCIDGVCIQNP